MRGVLKLASVKRSTPAMAAALPELPMAETVIVRLAQILRTSMHAYFDPMFRKVGFTESSFHVLCILLSSPGGCASPSELSELVGTSKANMTRILDLMEKENLVTRTVEAMDGRRYIVEITPEGREKSTAAVPRFNTSLKAAFSALTSEELSTLNALMQKAILSLDTGGITLQTDDVAADAAAVR